MQESEISPDFYRKIKHNQLRRADWHDYHSICFYLITIRKNMHPEVPAFSHLAVRQDGIVTTGFTWSGWAIHNALLKFAYEYPIIRLGRYCIMPDHIHIIIQITQVSEKTLGFYINKFKAIAAQCFRNKSLAYGCAENHIFEDGFNDRILLHNNQLDIWSNYVKDNPRRLWIMRHNPDYFRRGYTLTGECPSHILHDGLGKDDRSVEKHRFHTFGNGQLLRYPEKIVVRFSRRYSSEEWDNKQKEILRIAKNGGVLVSPCIHSEERRLVREGLLLGGRIIKVIEYGYAEKEKPQGVDFIHCSQGRMLIFALHPRQPGVKRDFISRSLCERMNECALWISRMQF